MVVLLNLVLSTFILWRTQQSIECNNKVLCFLINKLHKHLAVNEDYVFVSSEDDSSSIFLKTSIVNLADKNDDGKVSLGEIGEKSVEYLNDIFKLLDANNDNYLVRNETTLQNVSIVVVKEIMDEMFKIMDQDKDEQISSEDLPKKETFDLDMDGKVTLNELIKVASDNKAPDIIFLPRPFQTFIKNIDPSKDEKISFAEYESFINKVIDVLDEDNDLYLNLNEVVDVIGGNKAATKFILKPYESFVEEILKDLIKRADLKKDNKISLHEIIDFKDFEFLTNSIDSFKKLGHSKLNRNSRSSWAKILKVEDNVSLWLTLADRLLQRREFS